MGTNKLGEQILILIGLLIGLFVLHFAISITINSLPFNDYTFTIIRHEHFIGNFIYGLIIGALTRKDIRLSVSLGLLSIISPLYATVLYLLSIIKPRTSNA